MKKLVLFATLMCCAFLTYSQDSVDSSPTDAGTIYVNAQSDLSAIFSDNTIFSLGVGAGYFLIDNLVAGVNFAYVDTGFGSDERFELFGRYYLFNNIYGGVSHQFGDFDYTAVSAGVNLFFNDTVSLEPSLSLPLEDGADLQLNVRFGLFF